MMLNLADSDTAANMMLLLGVLVLVTGSMLWLRRRGIRPRPSRLEARDRVAEVREQLDLRKSSDALLIELESLSRRINAQVDTKLAKLDALLNTADDRIARLESLEASTPITKPESPDPQKTATLQPENPTVSDDPRHHEVYKLADQGKAPRDIAASLGIMQGEIELILNLRSFK